MKIEERKLVVNEVNEAIVQEHVNRKKNWIRERVYKIEELKRQIALIEEEIKNTNLDLLPLGGYPIDYKPGAR